MKYLTFPAMDYFGVSEPEYTICQTCFTPTLEFVLVAKAGGTPTDDFDEMVRQMDEAQIRDFGEQDPYRPEIVEEAPGLVCGKCGRVGEAVA